MNGECDNTAKASWNQCPGCGECNGRHNSRCPTLWPKLETPVVHHVYGLDEPTRKMIEQLLAGNLERLAGRIIGLLRKLNERLDLIMATEADFAARITAMETATTNLAAAFQALRDQLATGGISSGAEEAFLATFDAKIAALNAIGAPTP